MYSGQRLWKNHQKNRYVPEFMNNPIQPSSPMAFYSNTVLTDIGICVGMSNVNLNCENPHGSYPPNIANIPNIPNQSIDYFNSLICKPITTFEENNLHLYNGLQASSSSPQSTRCCDFEFLSKFPNGYDFRTYDQYDTASMIPSSSTSPLYSNQIKRNLPSINLNKNLLQRSLPSSSSLPPIVSQQYSPLNGYEVSSLPSSSSSSSKFKNSPKSIDYVKDTKLQYYKQYEMSKPLGHNNSHKNMYNCDDLARIKAPKKKWIRHYFEGIEHFIL